MAQLEDLSYRVRSVAVQINNLNYGMAETGVFSAIPVGKFIDKTN